MEFNHRVKTDCYPKTKAMGIRIQWHRKLNPFFITLFIEKCGSNNVLLIFSATTADCNSGSEITFFLVGR